MAANRTNSDAKTNVVFSKPGVVTLMMIVVMVLMKLIVLQIHLVPPAGSMSSNVEVVTNVFRRVSIVIWREIVLMVQMKLDVVSELSE